MLKRISKNILKRIFKNMYIDLKDIENRVCIDTRTKEEFILMKFFDFNIPVMTKEYHYLVRKCIALGPVLGIISMIERKQEIDYKLIELSQNKTKPLLFACSAGHLRSPYMCMYARLKGIDAKVLEGGIKHYFSKEEQSRYFDDIKNCIVEEEVSVTQEEGLIKNTI